VGRTQGEEALKHAIAAAELYMQAASNAKTVEDRKRLRRKCAELIELGERLKANNNNTVSDAASRPPVPESTRPLTTAEKTIILKASRLHGTVFPPWQSAPDPSSFSSPGNSGTPYMCVQQPVRMTANFHSSPLLTRSISKSDPYPFTFSDEQQAIFAGWRRPVEVAAVAGAGDGRDQGGSGYGQLMTAEAQMDLAQDLATDCSVVASLCAAARHFGPTKDSVSVSLNKILFSKARY
jgi:hypothetical protein